LQDKFIKEVLRMDSAEQLASVLNQYAYVATEMFGTQKIELNNNSLKLLKEMLCFTGASSL